jgi:hypothetical protein
MPVAPARHDALLADMHLALLAEFGAQAMYGYLSRNSGDVELAGLLSRFHAEEADQIERLRSVITALGGRSPRRSRRRRFAAWLLSLTTWVGGQRLALRLCLESEETIARWYAHHAVYLGEAGLADHARTCGALSVTKRRHAQALQAWVGR